MTEGSTAQPAGWYYAQGDAPGTQRYWDGAQWQGLPMPVATSAQPGAVAHGAHASLVPAGADHGPRIVAAIIDGAIGTAVFVVYMVLVVVSAALGDAAIVVTLLVGLVAVTAVSFYLGVYMPGATGQTFGKRSQGIKMINVETNQPPGVLVMFLRQILSGLISSFFWIDTIWILVDDDRRRLADKAMNTHVVPV